PFRSGHGKPEGRLVEPEQLALRAESAAVHEHRCGIRREVMQGRGLESPRRSGANETRPRIGAEGKLGVWVQDVRLDLVVRKESARVTVGTRRALLLKTLSRRCVPEEYVPPPGDVLQGERVEEWRGRRRLVVG